MKKLLLGFIMAGVLLVGTVSTFAAAPATQQQNFVDANGDGVCDHSANNTRPHHAQDGTGFQHGRGMHHRNR